MINIALPKGRLGEKAYNMLKISGYECPEILSTLEKYGVKQCCYGHLHGPTIRRRMEGPRNGTEYALISADYLGFVPKKICD